MREYKFRAWDKRKEKFRDDVYIDGDGNLYEFSKKTGYGTAISYLNDEYIDVTQCTGLVDKSGQEIYEGDVYHLGDENIKYIVVWHDASLIGNQIGTSGYAGLSYWQDDIEILGNIFENPELIKGRQK